MKITKKKKVSHSAVRLLYSAQKSEPFVVHKLHKYFAITDPASLTI
jgi:hypothetical protein